MKTLFQADPSRPRRHRRQALALAALLAPAFLLAWFSVPAGADSGAPATVKAEPLAAIAARMKPGEWYEIPNSSIRNVLVSRDNPDIQGRPQHAIYGWNGAAFDGNCLYFHGGGHRGYSGNEVYDFCLDSLSWRRLTEPSPVPDGTRSAANNTEARCPYPGDGTPRTVHTYDGFIWTPVTRSIFRFKGIGWCKLGNAYGQDVWEFDPASRRWTQHADAPAVSFGMATALDPATGEIYVKGRRGIWSYSPATDQWRKRSGKIGGGLSVMAIDPDRNVLVIGDRKGIRTFSLAGNARKAKPVPLTGFTPPPATDSSHPYFDHFGLAYSTRAKSWVLWAGGKTAGATAARQVYTLDIDSGKMNRFTASSGPARAGDGSGRKGSGGVYSKWVYVKAHDIFVGYDNVDQGVWLYKLADPSQADPLPAPLAHKVCKAASCATFTNLFEAAEAVTDGATLTISPGTHFAAFQVTACDVVVNAREVHLKGTAFGGKGAIVVKTPDGCTTTVVGLECSRISVSDRNGACLRLQRGNLILDQVYFHDSEEGVLASKCGSVLVKNSRFERLGAHGRAHGFYVNCDSFTIRGSKILCGQGEGHSIKSGSKRTIIENNVIDSQDCLNSREIDIYCGGDIRITGNVIRKGAKKVRNIQRNMVGIGMERKRCNYGGRAFIDGNKFYSGLASGVVAIKSWIPVTGNNSFEGTFKQQVQLLGQ